MEHTVFEPNLVEEHGVRKTKDQKHIQQRSRRTVPQEKRRHIPRARLDAKHNPAQGDARRRPRTGQPLAQTMAADANDAFRTQRAPRKAKESIRTLWPHAHPKRTMCSGSQRRRAPTAQNAHFALVTLFSLSLRIS